MIGAAPSVAEGIGTQSVKVLLVRMCLCLAGTHESMFSCMNTCLRSFGMCVLLLGWYKRCYVSLEEYVCIWSRSIKVMLLRMCLCLVVSYESMFSRMNVCVLCILSVCD